MHFSIFYFFKLYRSHNWQLITFAIKIINDFVHNSYGYQVI